MASGVAAPPGQSAADRRMDPSANEFRQRAHALRVLRDLQTLRALLRMAHQRGLTLEEQQVVEELIETLCRLLLAPPA